MTPKEAAEAKIVALQWASKALRSLGTWDAVKAIDERIAALALPAAPSEPTAASAERVALRKLAAEVRGLYSIAELSLREAVGDTNTNVLKLRLDEADAILAEKP